MLLSSDSAERNFENPSKPNVTVMEERRWNNNASGSNTLPALRLGTSGQVSQRRGTTLPATSDGPNKPSTLFQSLPYNQTDVIGKALDYDGANSDEDRVDMPKGM